MTLKQKQDDFIELFNSFSSWQEKFQYLIDIGDKLPDSDNSIKNQKNRIQNCISNTFFCPYISDGIIKIEGWSNAAIPSGLIAMIKAVFEGSLVEELEYTDIYFQIETELVSNLTLQRKASLNEMLSRLYLLS